MEEIRHLEFAIVLEEKIRLIAELQSTDIHILGTFGERNPVL